MLDEFQSKQKAVPRLAISTLGSGVESSANADAQVDGGVDSTNLTNQIQKKLVKQLVFRAKPSTLRHSRFRLRDTLLWRHAVGESAALVGALQAQAA